MKDKERRVATTKKQNSAHIIFYLGSETSISPHVDLPSQL